MAVKNRSLHEISGVGTLALSSLWKKSVVTSVAAGVVMLGGSGFASAVPTALESKADSKTTDDGWVIGVKASELSANSVPNLALTQFTREGFFSSKTTGTITGRGTSAVRTGYIEQGLQVGCQVDVSSGVTVGLAASIGPSVGVSVTGPNAGVNANVGPSVSTQIKPGTITTIPLGKKTLEGAKASVTTSNLHVKIDGCLGGVSIRSYSMLAVSTSASDDSLYVYSEPTWL
jgi:hypothetical protein